MSGRIETRHNDTRSQLFVPLLISFTFGLYIHYRSCDIAEKENEEKGVMHGAPSFTEGIKITPSLLLFQAH